MSIRYLYGDTNPVLVKVATAQAVAKGDIVAMQANTLIRAEDATWDTNLATTQEEFVGGTNNSAVTFFAGISAQTKNTDSVKGVRPYGNSVDNQIRVNTGGVYEGDCASATFEVGQFVGPAKQSGNLLETQKVVGVADNTVAIGRVVERGTSVTTVKFQIISQIPVGTNVR